MERAVEEAPLEVAEVERVTCYLLLLRWAEKLVSG